MTELLKHAFAVASALPDEQQDEIAGVLLGLAGDDSAVIILTPEERADLAEALEEVERGETISLEEAQANWAEYGS